MDESTKDDDDDEETAQTYHLLLMMKEAFEPRKLGEVCYELGSLTQFEKCVDIMEEYHAHVLVLEMMESLRQHSDNQLAGLCTINSMMKASQKLLTLIEKQNIVSVINDILGRYEDDSQIQSTIFQTISILAEFGESRTVLLEEQIVDFILESMQRDQFTSDVSLQSTACKAIRCLLIGNDNLQIEFVELDHHKVFINLLSSHHDNPSVLEEAMLLLALLASQEEKYDFILQASQYLIADIMKSYPDNAELQTAACVFLKNLARTVDDQQLLVVKGIYPLVVHILRTFHIEVKAQVAALEVLDKIAGAVLTSPTWLGYRLSDICWLEESFLAMTYHPGSIPCQVLACKVLCHLLESQPNILDALGEDDSPSLALDNAVLTGLRLYGDTELSVFVATARTIYHLAVNSKILQEHLVTKGAHLDINIGMNIFWDNSDAQGAACQAITGLCHASFPNKSKFAQMGLHIRIFASLKKFSTIRPFLDEAVHCITCLADVDVVRNQCMVEGIHEVFMQAMVDSQEDSTFQELSLEAMSVLSKAEGMVDILCEAGLLNNTVKIMEKFDHCENIQQKGSILFQTLITHQKASFDTHLSKQVASAIITSMNKFKHDTNVLAESCVALQLLADKSEEVSRVLVECQIHSVLFMVLEQYGSHEVLTDLVCEVLYILCCRWDFKNEMIIWACKNNLNRGVEVLLQLGANVNTGSGRESPLCYACQNNNEEMMVLILEQNVSDMQTALKYCLDLEFHHLAGIILAYIGYDQEVGNVTWSNLSLNDLHARWFFPTFGKEAAKAFTTSTVNISAVDSSLASRILSKEAQRHKRTRMRYLLSEQNKRRSSLSLIKTDDVETASLLSSEAGNAVITETSPVHQQRSTATKWHSEVDNITEVDSVIPLRSPAFARDKRSYSISEGTTFGRRRLLSLDSSSGIRRPSSFIPLRKPSLSSAELPIHADDPRWLDSFQGDSLSEDGLKSFHGSIPDTTSLSLTQTYNLSATNSLSPNSDGQLKRLQTSDYSLYESTSPILRTPRFALSAAEVSESSAMEDYASDAQMPDHLPKDVFASTPYRRKLSMPKRKKHRLSSSSTTGSIDWCPNITYLNLSSNSISSLDAIISERYLLSQFQYLTKLDLSKNKLTEVTKDILQALQELDNFDVSGNQLISFPAETFSYCSKLQVLNVSSNEIYSLPDVPEDSCKALHELDISHNPIGKCPMWLSEYTPNLKVLVLQRTNISSLSEQSLALPCLTTLNLSHNLMSDVPGVFLEGCPCLETLNLSHNKLESLPMHPPENLSKLNVLKLGNNKLGNDIPGFVLSLPSLKSIDLSNNVISTFAAPYQWKSSSLREVNLSHNKIKELSLDKKFDLRNWLKLEKLLLSHNKISKIPKELGQLTALCTLDISYNKEITTIPDQLGTLSKLWEFILDGLKLDLDPVIRKSRTKDIIGFLNQKLKKAVPYFRMKLMVVGYGGRGKSSLLARLRKDKPGKRRVSTATVGIDVDELKVPVMHNKKSEAFHLTTWDIAGQEDFYSTHPCFLSGRALFLVVYDLNKGTEEVRTIRNWLLTIQALAPFSPLIVVGTHKDKIPKEHLSERIRTIHYRIKELCQARGFPTVEMFAEVSCLHDDADMEKLRRMIQDAIERARIKGQPIVGQKIPHSYKLLEEFFQEEAIRLKTLGCNPIMVQSEVLKKVREKEIPLSEEELVQAARFLHETGVILHYDDPSLHLEHLYFVQPEWLCKIMAQIITVREINPFINSQGVMKKKDIYQLIKSTVDQSSHFVPTYINLLEKFEVALPLSDVELLIPSKVPSTKPKIELPPASKLLRRYYNMPYTPVGLWPRLILRLLQFSTDMLRGEEINESFERTSKYWREGIYVCWSKEVFFVVDSVKCTDREAIAIVVPPSAHGYRVFGQVCDHLDDLIEEWYPGLNETDPTSGNTLLQRFVPCVGCEGSESCPSTHHFTFEELLVQVEVSDTIRCEHHCDPVPIKHLAPDITFADLDASLHIDENHLKISFNEVLGEGSFGSVYEAKYKGKMVAVKTFANRSDVHPHRMMRQEVTVLRHLQHPCLVSMEGVAFKHRMLVMELAHLGSLGSLLNSEKGHLNRKLQHKIAVQIADGLAFLHENRIVYRDLKPDNILIFSLQPGAPQNVKISDYGISRFTTPYGLKASEGTPGYRAPEVIKGTSTYNTEVDIFSYGILLYELVTEGHKPFQDLDFRTEIEEAVVKGRGIPQITECGVSAWPDMQDLINNCTENAPQKRPTASMVLQRLQSPDFLCLKQTYAIGSINAEAMTVRKYRKSKDLIHEVWMTGGESSATMISLINPFTSSTKALVQGTMLEEGRGSCILAAGENLIIVGTQEGKLCVIEPTKEFAGPIVLKHSVTLPDAVLCLIHQARANNEGRILAGLANGTLLVYDVHTLRTDPNGKPVKYHQLNVSSLSPLSCIVQYKAKLYVGCGNHIAILNADSLDVESRLIKNIETDKSEPGQVRFIAVDKSVWICRRSSEDSNFIEVWDPGKEAFKTQLDIASLLREYDPHLTEKECDIKSMMLQPNMALWVGVAGGHLALIDRHTSKLITLVYRYTEALRTIVSVKSPESNNPLGGVVVTAGKGFMERPGSTECRVDENCVHVLVWDSNLKNQVKYVQSEIDRRNRGAQASWQKVQRAIRVVNAFRKSH